MGLNDTPNSDRIHIGFFGRRNAGKSSLVNAVTGQELCVVSEKKGTTTDPVQKAMELLPLGPVLIIDTPGYDDEGNLGTLRVRKAKQILNKTDMAILVVDGTLELSEWEQELVGIFKEKKIPYVIVRNKCDVDGFFQQENTMTVSATTGEGIHELKEKMGSLIEVDDEKLRIVGDLIEPSDMVVLIIPIDKSAPKGRLILPQQQVIRDVLEADGISVVVKEDRILETIHNLAKKPALVITDSQVFERVAKEVPIDISLTSFSILMARYKGFLDTAVKGIRAVDQLQDGDKILIAEGCTHHRQCEDIGVVKIPNWIKEYTGKQITFETCSGTEFPEDLSPYKLIFHCGGCMLNEREVQYRMKCAIDQQVPFTNYGVAIAYMKGILDRCLECMTALEK